MKRLSQGLALRICVPTGAAIASDYSDARQRLRVPVDGAMVATPGNRTGADVLFGSGMAR